MDRQESWDKKTRPELQSASVDCFKLGAKVRAVGGYAKSLKSQRDFAALAERAADHLDAAARILGDYLNTPSASGTNADGGLVSGCVNRLLRGFSKPESAPDSHADESRNFSGHSSAINTPEVLEFLSFYQKSGTLDIAAEDENFTLELENGEVTNAASDCTPPGLRLGELLVHQGALSATHLRKYLSNPASKGRLGQLLFDDGVVDTAQLRKALETQVQQLFVRLFAAKETYFVFREGTRVDSDGRLRMNVTSLLLESASAADEQAATDDDRDVAQPAA